MIHSTKNDQYWLLTILVPVMIKPSGSGSFFGKNWALESIEVSEVAEVAEVTEVNEAGEVPKAWKITIEDSSAAVARSVRREGLRVTISRL